MQIGSKRLPAIEASYSTTSESQNDRGGRLKRLKEKLQKAPTKAAIVMTAKSLRKSDLEGSKFGGGSTSASNDVSVEEELGE